LLNEKKVRLALDAVKGRWNVVSGNQGIFGNEELSLKTKKVF
jgi:hypothetical protein